MTGTAIILNGASSAGKSLIAAELLQWPGSNAIGTGFDDMLDRQAAENNGFFKRLSRHFDPRFRLNTFRRLHTEIVALLDEHRHVIVDTAIMEPAALADLADRLAERRAYLIGVKPPLSVSETWERQRGDRPIGQARKHYDLVHRHNTYDLLIDTSRLPPAEAASLILQHIAQHPPQALAALKQAAL